MGAIGGIPAVTMATARPKPSSRLIELRRRRPSEPDDDWTKPSWLSFPRSPMYQPIETVETITLLNGSEAQPVGGPARGFS
jgi:hypothetical protein